MQSESSLALSYGFVQQMLSEVVMPMVVVVPRIAALSAGERRSGKVNKDVKTSPLMLLPFPLSLLTLDPIDQHPR